MSSWSSAFVPFCAYKTSLNFSKESYALEGTDFPLCSSFLPTILEGQLCYKLDLKKVSGNGKENELMLLLDYNEERSLQISSNKSITTKTSNETLNFGTAVDNIQGSSVKIVINTLSSFTGFGGGVFKMTDVKRMTAKEDFLKMPFKDKRCEVELYEDCRTRKLLEECNCVPQELSRFQVGFFCLSLIFHLTYRTWRSVMPREETVSRKIPPRLSTATQLVLGSMPTSCGKGRTLRRS